MGLKAQVNDWETRIHMIIGRLSVPLMAARYNHIYHPQPANTTYTALSKSKHGPNPFAFPGVGKLPPTFPFGQIGWLPASAGVPGGAVYVSSWQYPKK